MMNSPYHITNHERVRRENARECTAVVHRVTSYNTVWKVRKPEGEWHYVEFAEREFRCDCNDWARFEKPCKHIYAVLNSLGVRSVTEYIAKRESEEVTRRIERAPLKMASVRPLIIRGVTIE
jgi:hypothetical protein